MRGVEVLSFSLGGVPECGSIGVCDPLTAVFARGLFACGRGVLRSHRLRPSSTWSASEGRRGSATARSAGTRGSCGDSIHDSRVNCHERLHFAATLASDSPFLECRTRCDAPCNSVRPELAHKKRCRIPRSRPTDSYKESLPTPSLRHHRSGPFPLHGEHEDHSLARDSPARLCFCRSSGLQLVAQLPGLDAHPHEPVLGQLGVQEEPGQVRLDLAADHVAQLPGP